MPAFYQQQINDHTRLGVWKIEETEDFFKNNVPNHREVTHPHKRLQHLAGRFLLQKMFPDFPYHLIKIADTRKPFLPDAEYFFSISHCGDFAAAIVSETDRVGVDIEEVKPLVGKLVPKFLSDEEQHHFKAKEDLQMATICWSAKEAVFKWYGEGQVDFKQHIQLNSIDTEKQIINCFFIKTNQSLSIHYRLFGKLVLSWVV